MKKYVFLLIYILSFLPLSAQIMTEEGELTESLSALPSDSLPWPMNVQARIDSLLTHPMFQTSTVGLMVYDLTADSTIYRHNHRLSLRPASTMKLVTAITAIDRLGPNYQFRTSLYYKGTIHDHTLWGDLYCVGGMDPAFDADDLNVFVENLRAMGIDTIRGRIVADCSMKDTQQWGEGWCWDDDNPILSPLLIARKSDFVERFVSVLFNSGAVLTDVSTYSGTLPSDAFIVCSRAHSITQILERMMKDSDNLYAESMFYQVAASAGHRPATAKDARTFTEQLIKRIGLNPKNYRIADGSGLSLYNYVSAELEVALLRYAWYNKHIGNSLLRSLPIAGEDGTLRKRMQQPFTGGNVIAKTGTVTGVSSLAGYLVAGNGHMICFSIINQGILRNSTGQRFQDRVCTVLCQP